MMKSSLLNAKTTSELSTPTTLNRPRKVKARVQYKSYRKKNMKSGRKCRICGNDPYPNYFFCPPCHHRTSVYEENE